MKFGEHRYLCGQPITLLQPVHGAGQIVAWLYAHGHVTIDQFDVGDLVPLKES